MWAIILIVCCFVELVICCYALLRNSWVYKQRNKILRSSTFDGKEFIPYSSLPAYGEMVDSHGFWIWDINYYLSKNESLK